MPRRHSLFPVLAPVARDLLLKRARSLRFDAPALIEAAGVQVQVMNRDCVPERGPLLLVTNHYTRPGFGVWWAGLALSAVLPLDLHWIITGAWTGSLLTPLSRWLLQRVAVVYGFTAMPPMPPDPRDAAGRAAAVRRVITYARGSFNPVVALMPEGRDFPGSRLGSPPTGAGRFMLHLSEILGTIIPAAVYEDGDNLVLKFGPPFSLDLPPGLWPAQQDTLASRMVMERLSALLPLYLHSDG